MTKSRTPTPPTPRVPIKPGPGPRPPADDPCAEVMEFEFDASPVPLGTPVDLVPDAGLVTVFAAGLPIGRLRDGDVTKVRACVSRGYMFLGYVTGVGSNTLQIVVSAGGIPA